jgi:hypothetical protein
MVWTPTLCKPDTLDRPLLSSFNLLNLAMPLLSYAVRLVLLILVLLSSLLCYLYDAILNGESQEEQNQYGKLYQPV